MRSTLLEERSLILVFKRLNLLVENALMGKKLAVEKVFSGFKMYRKYKLIITCTVHYCACMCVYVCVFCVCVCMCVCVCVFVYVCLCVFV